MRSPAHFLFFGATVSGDVLRLDAEEARHMHAVLRAQPGDTVRATSGDGAILDCRVKSVGRDSAELTVVSRLQGRVDAPVIHCYVGIPDKEAFEVMLENLGPLGITSLTPVNCEACQEKWWKSGWEKYEERFTRKIVAGLKQSLNPRLPRLSNPFSFERALSAVTGRILFADSDGESIRDVLPNSQTPHEEVSCWIGPPGGFSPEELLALRARGATPIYLGPHRLRTETAMVVMCGTIRALGERKMANPSTPLRVNIEHFDSAQCKYRTPNTEHPSQETDEETKAEREMERTAEIEGRTGEPLSYFLTGDR